MKKKVELTSRSRDAESPTQNGRMGASAKLTPLEIRTTRFLPGLRLSDIGRHTKICTSTLSLVERGLLPLTPVRERLIREALAHAVPKPGGAPRVRAPGKDSKLRTRA